MAAFSGAQASQAGVAAEMHPAMSPSGDDDGTVPAADHLVAFVTGASSGIGRAVAVRLAQEGYAVGLAARREERLREVAGDVDDYHGTASVHPCDVSDPEQVSAAVAACRLQLGSIDLVVCNAGIGARSPPAGLDAGQVERVFAVNFMGAVHVVERVLPEMLRRGSGHVVAIASLAGLNGIPSRAAYSASKAAMIAFFESLRMDLRGSGVAVTVVNPGFVRTEMTEADDQPRPFIMEVDPAADRIMRSILAKRPSASFPWPLAPACMMARALPRRCYDRLVGATFSRRARTG